MTCRLDSSVLCILEHQLCVHLLLFRTWQLRVSQVSPAGSPDFRKWESCRTMPLVGGFSRGSPVSPTPSFRRRSIFTSITLIGSQDLAVKSRPNLFTHSNNSFPRSTVMCKITYIFILYDAGSCKIRFIFWQRAKLQDFICPFDFCYWPAICNACLEGLSSHTLVAALSGTGDCVLLLAAANEQLTSAGVCRGLKLLAWSRLITRNGRVFANNTRRVQQGPQCLSGIDSPPLSNANGVQSMAGSLPDFRMWGS
ncbi:hypothetical protein PR048_024530 [Dryococelus australis]|uniref:Uncharacterized protein n=1 Tax=Dryococelus australis TaxID=614101 RepID=A0ABQ9GNW8_9NEOP|nr:hypothetical protein PR048_024530 [Dryococelus australis]